MACFLWSHKRTKNSGEYFQKNWVWCAARFLKALPYFRPKSLIFPALFKNFIPYFRLDYEQSLLFLGPSNKTPESRRALPLLNLKKKRDCSQSNFRPEALEPSAWPKRMTSCYGTYTVVGVNIKSEMVLSPNDEEETNSSKKHTQFKTRRHKPYPVSDQNGRNWYPISNQNG